MSTLQKPAIRPSASLIIAAPEPLDAKGTGCNYRILMMKRNAKSSFINAHVYPGGIVDNADHYSNWEEESKLASTEKEKNILTNKICAIRETFEESGLLLSDPPAHTIKDLDVNLWRHKVHDDATQFKVMCKKYNIRPAVSTLQPFSNWITPPAEKKRYNTLFFITTLNQFTTKQEHDLHYHLVAADGKETVLFGWFKPEEAIQQQKEKKIVMIPPQWYSLTLLGEYSDYNDLVGKAGIGAFRTTSNEVITILPQPNRSSEDGFDMFLAYPGDEVYQSDKYKSKEGNRHRLYFKGRMEEFKLEKNIDVSDIVPNISNL